MSALAAYTAAQADEMTSRAQLNRSQLGLVNMQTANYGDESLARQNEMSGAAAASRGQAALSNAQAVALPNSEAAKANDLNAAADATRQQAQISLAKLPFETTALGLANQGQSIQNDYTPQRFQSDLTTAGLQQQGLRIDNAPIDPLRAAALATPSTDSGALHGLYSLLQNPQLLGAIARGEVPIPGQNQPGQQVQNRSKGGLVGPGQPQGAPSPKDTQPTMLQPGEAVLNKEAVEHYGPDVVDQMNRMGMLRGAAKAELHAMTKKMQGKKKAT